MSVRSVLCTVALASPKGGGWREGGVASEGRSQAEAPTPDTPPSPVPDGLVRAAIVPDGGADQVGCNETGAPRGPRAATEDVR